MADTPLAGGAQGAQGSQAADPKNPNQDAEAGAPNADPVVDKVTAEVRKHLVGINNAFDQKTEKLITQKVDDLKKGFDSSVGDLKKTVAQVLELFQAQKEKSSSEKQDPAFELNTLKKRLEETEGASAKVRAELDAARDEGRRIRIEARTREALQDAKCIDPELALMFLGKQGALHLKDDGNVVAKVKDDYGAEGELGLKDYVSKYVRPRLGHLFEGSNRNGSPASGDRSGPAGGWKYSIDDVSSEQYAKDPKFQAEVDAALERGEIRGLPAKAEATIKARRAQTTSR